MKYKGSGSKVGDTAKISQDQFSRRANMEVLRGSDASSYTVPKPIKDPMKSNVKK